MYIIYATIYMKLIILIANLFHLGIESAFLEIIKLFDDTKKILFSVFTRTPIVIISTPEDCLTAQNFITALSVFIPRRKE